MYNGLKSMLRKTAKSLRTPPQKRGPYTPEPKRLRVISRHMAGESARRIASAEGIDRETVARILTQEDAVDCINRCRSQLLLLMPKVLRAVEELLNCDDPRVKAAIAMKLVDKLGSFEQLIGLANTLSDRELQKYAFLGRLTEMVTTKAKQHGIPLPPEYNGLEDEAKKRLEGVTP
jgi:hypothetical protein